MKAPSARARLVLERYKAASAWGADEKARLGDVIRERVLRGDLPRFDVQPGSPGAPHASLARQAWSSSLGKLGVVIAIAGASSGVVYQLRKGSEHSELQAPAATVAHVPREPREAAVAAPVVSQELIAAPPRDEAPQAQARSAPPRGKTGKSTEAPPPNVAEATIDDEVKLVSDAQAALRIGNTGRALELLSEHEARFPSGKLATLRQVTHMMALCQAGRAAQARQEAARFLDKNPNSPFAERVNGICSAPKSSP
jgi:hypothetical protein